MKTPHVYIFVPGIRTLPGAADNWTGRAVTWCHVNQVACAEKVEYFTLAITRPFRQAHRAAKLEKTLGYYFRNGFNVTIAAHSNGADVVLDTLQGMREKGTLHRVAALHLVSAACSANANQNGLNSLAEYIDRIRVYIALRDRAMALAASWIGHALGYGTLGRDGLKAANFAHETIRRDYGHSGWWSRQDFPHTMKLLTDDPA